MREILREQIPRLSLAACVGLLLPHVYWLLLVTGVIASLPGNISLWLGYLVLSLGVVPVALLVWFAARAKVPNPVSLCLAAGSYLLILFGNYSLIAWWFVRFFYRA